MSRISQAQLERISSSADALVRAAVKQIDRWLREGLSLEEILKRLRKFRLPPGEVAKLSKTLESAMNEIVSARSAVVKELSKADILEVKAAARLSFPEFKTIEKSLQRQLTATVQRAIASKAGVSALRHELKKREFPAAKTLANTSLRQFNNELTLATAEITGTNKFLYGGPVTRMTRPFCKKHAGKIYSLAQIEQMDNGQGLPVRSSLGGYNCRHFWIAQPD